MKPILRLLQGIPPTSKAPASAVAIPKETAATLRMADIINERPTDLAQFGFVFSVEEVDSWIRDETALAAAQGTIAAARPGGRNQLN